MKLCKKIVIITPIVAILLGVTSMVALGAQFRNTRNSQIFSFNQTYTSFWVGYGQNNFMSTTSLVQAVYNAYGNPAIAVDGYMGNDTNGAIWWLQSYYNVPRDGVVGPTTWSRIEAIFGYPTSGGVWFIYP